MALTKFQYDICRLLAERRRQAGESYVAGGAALNFLLKTPRRSQAIDLFHDTTEALVSSWTGDHSLLQKNGCHVQVSRESPSFVEAFVSRNTETVQIQWVRDSAFRFFPLIEDEALGLALHPFDLATNKVLAMAGRLEPRDWIDVINCCQKIQPLGYLIWAACGKDPGFNPHSLLQEIQRGSHYTQDELDTLDFEGPSPCAKQLGEIWHTYLQDTTSIIQSLPEEEQGKAVLTKDGVLCQEIGKLFETSDLRYHRGSIRGVWPSVTTKSGARPQPS